MTDLFKTFGEIFNPKKNNYEAFLLQNHFNKEQIELCWKVMQDYEMQREENKADFNGWVDGWERDQWYTFNQSGLFEADEEENKTGITNWTQGNTRYYITEYSHKPIF